MWKAFAELRDAGWVSGPVPRLYAVQAEGCAPVVRAVERGQDRCDPWPDPLTEASGLRVPAPLGDRLILRAVRESRGGALAVSDRHLVAAAQAATRSEGVDLSPEGGAALAAVEALLVRGLIRRDERVVAFNTGAGWLYRRPSDLPVA
jgi:threonine synthase